MPSYFCEYKYFRQVNSLSDCVCLYKLSKKIVKGINLLFCFLLLLVYAFVFNILRFYLTLGRNHSFRLLQLNYYDGKIYHYRTKVNFIVLSLLLFNSVRPAVYCFEYQRNNFPHEKKNVDAKVNLNSVRYSILRQIQCKPRSIKNSLYSILLCLLDN